MTDLQHREISTFCILTFQSVECFISNLNDIYADIIELVSLDLTFKKDIFHHSYSLLNAKNNHFTIHKYLGNNYLTTPGKNYGISTLRGYYGTYPEY